MRAQIEILSEVFTEWLRLQGLDYDFWIYTRKEWAERKEDVLQGAELVLAFENQLVSILNYSGHWEAEEALQELAAGFGYYFKMGHQWNIGFYPLDNWPPLPPPGTPYEELLKDSRWQAKRKTILKRANGRCEDCEIPSRSLDIHHCYYRYERCIWQYPNAAFLALCPKCHKKRKEEELAWRGFMPRMRIGELQTLRESLERSLYWYDRRALFTFLNSLPQASGEGMQTLGSLLATRGHPENREKKHNKILGCDNK